MYSNILVFVVNMCMRMRVKRLCKLKVKKMSVAALLFYLILYYLTKGTDSLRCYACADSGSCETSYAVLIHDRNRGGDYNRNCSAPNQHYCMIESIKKEDKDVSFIRDCSDGHTFSYKDIPRLNTVLPNNQSTCAYYQAYVICISVCRTDFCNGPQEGISSGCTINTRPLALTLLLFWIVT